MSNYLLLKKDPAVKNLLVTVSEFDAAKGSWLQWIQKMPPESLMQWFPKCRTN
jgi:hypothetical protein